jgi:hypothetical protein
MTFVTHSQLYVNWTGSLYSLKRHNALIAAALHDLPAERERALEVSRIAASIAASFPNLIDCRPIGSS